MTITFEHPRTEWQDPKFPVRGPQFSWNNLKLGTKERRHPGIAIHYGGVKDAPDGDVDEPWTIFDDFLRRVDAGHRAKGYSFAYNFALDARGELWQARGEQYRNAANKGDYFYVVSDPLTNQNLYTISVLCVVDDQDRLTPAATERMRKFVREVRASSKADLPYRPHKYWDATQCCGLGIIGQIERKEFDSSPPIGDVYVNWKPAQSTIDNVNDAPPVDLVVNNRANDWAAIALPKAIQIMRGLPVTGKYDQATAQAVDDALAQRKGK